MGAVYLILRDAVLRTAPQDEVERGLQSIWPDVYVCRKEKSMDDKTRTELEAAVYRRLVEHLRQRRVRESHPELVFLGLNRGKPLPKKSTPEGLAARRRLLRRHGLATIDALAAQMDRRGARLDDLYDAAALALAARRFAAGAGTCLDGGHDARGVVERWAVGVGAQPRKVFDVA